jgi:hypothetical protein
VEIRVAVAKQKFLGFNRITLGVHNTLGQAVIALDVGIFYCGNGHQLDISDPQILSSLLPLEKLDKLPPTEMKKQIQKIVRWVLYICWYSSPLDSSRSWTHQCSRSSSGAAGGRD